MALRTDYKNAVFSGKRKYHLIENEDGTVSLLDATQYSQTGDRFGAKDVNAIGTAVNGLADSIGDAFSGEKAYAVGEYAIYENVLYEFTAAKAAGPWEPDAATPTTIAEVVRELNGNMTTMSANMTRMSIISGTIVTNDFSSYDQHWKGSVRFPTAFKNNSVLVTVTPSNGYVGVIVSNISKTGFDLDVVNEYNGNLSKRYMRWIAVGFV